MVQDRKSAEYSQDRTNNPVKFVAAPVASLGIRHALRDAFSCEKETAEVFERLLAKLN